MSVNRKAPRELRSWVKPSPSAVVAMSRRETGRLKAKRCPMRRSTPTGGAVIGVSLPLGIARGKRTYNRNCSAVRPVWEVKNFRADTELQRTTSYSNRETWWRHQKKRSCLNREFQYGKARRRTAGKQLPALDRAGRRGCEHCATATS